MRIAPGPVDSWVAPRLRDNAAKLKLAENCLAETPEKASTSCASDRHVTEDTKMGSRQKPSRLIVSKAGRGGKIRTCGPLLPNRGERIGFSRFIVSRVLNQISDTGGRSGRDRHL